MLHTARIAPTGDLRLGPELHDKGPIGRQGRGGLQVPVGFCPWLWYVPIHEGQGNARGQPKSRGSSEITARKLRGCSEGKTEEPVQTAQQVIFDRYRLDLAREQLWCGSKEIPLPGKAFALLRYLVEHAGQLVSKAELFAALWPGTAVTDGALTFCIVELRKALGDKAKAPRFIETVHRRGYRFIAPLTTRPVVSHQLSVISEQKLAVSPPLATGNWQLTTRLVGREAELAQLHSWLAKALRGERQIGFVTGEPGIGKTTLIDAFLQSLASRVPRLESEDQQPLLVQARTLDPRHQTLDTYPWLGRGSALSSTAPANRTCRSWKHWDDWGASLRVSV